MSAQLDRKMPHAHDWQLRVTSAAIVAGAVDQATACGLLGMDLRTDGILDWQLASLRAGVPEELVEAA